MREISKEVVEKKSAADSHGFSLSKIRENCRGDEKFNGVSADMLPLIMVLAAKARSAEKNVVIPTNGRNLLLS